MDRRLVWTLALAGGMLLPAAASAHLGLDSPQSRYGYDELKYGPCGITGGPRSDNVTTFAPGETITVSWTEYIDHPGHYRISFDEDGDDDFVYPASPDDLYSNAAVLIDGIEDLDGNPPQDPALYSVQVTLPDVECQNCTLQVVQVMTDKQNNGWGNDDLYFQCADLVLDAAATSDSNGEGDTTGGNTSGDDTSSGGNTSPTTTATQGNTSSDETSDGSASVGGTEGESSGAMEDEGDGCACRSSGSPVPAWLLIVLVGLRRRYPS